MKKPSRSTRRPLVYVLILNWNGRSLTVDCVEAVLKSDYPNFRVVVIDNGSTDDSVAFLRKRFGRRIDIIENGKNLGYADGFNTGLKYAFQRQGSDYCLVMNNDTVIDRLAISEYVKVAESDEMIGFVTGKVYFFDHPNVLQTVGMNYDPVRWRGDHIGRNEIDIGQYDEVCERVFADDVYTLVRRSMYEVTGGYNPLFFLQSEETDWQARAKEYGYKIVYTPYARLWHRVSITIGKDSPLKAYYDARNPMLVILIHKTADFFRRYFWHYLRSDILRSSLVYLKRGRVGNAMAKWRGLLSGLIWGLQNRRFTMRHFV
ncbi:MAG: glycosyltransferase family 2 protein [candidate division WOR-3 bacterium]|nr:MAG: glycosyltransferase family 2 protein [candidate division WOR-3 bacterium]